MEIISSSTMNEIKKYVFGKNVSFVFPHQTRVFDKNLFDKDVEVCAYLVPYQDSKLKLDNITLGKIEEYSPGKYRNMCRHRKYTRIIFHTHPLAAYAYPSTEDIIKVMKNHNVIRRSIISTKWGIWDIKNTDKSNWYPTDHHTHNTFYEFIKSHLDNIGRDTKSKNTQSKHKSKTLSSKDPNFYNDMKIITENIKEIKLLLHLDIDLHLWEDIDRNKNTLVLT